MLNIERVTTRSQHKVLHEGLGRVIVSLNNRGIDIEGVGTTKFCMKDWGGSSSV